MKKLISIAGVVIAIIAGLSVWQLSKPKVPTSVTSKTQSSPQVLPVSSNPINNPSTQAGLVIKSAAAEDNIDPSTKQPVGDRLQLTLQNTSSQTMSGLEVYYTMKDAKTGQTEAYYQKLTGLQLAPNETTTIAFDNEAGAGHYPENKYSLYRSSQNQVDFTVEVSAPGFTVVTTTAKKSAGTGETAG